MEFEPRIYYNEPSVAKSEADELVLEWIFGEGDNEYRIMYVTGGEEGTYVIETFLQDNEVKQYDYWGEHAVPALLSLLEKAHSAGKN